MPAVPTWFEHRIADAVVIPVSALAGRSTPVAVPGVVPAAPGTAS